MDIFLQADEEPSEETVQQIDRLPAMSEGDQAVYNAIKRTYNEDKRTAEALPVDGDDKLPAATGAAVYQSLLKRDAYEHYLFIRTFITTACASWSSIVVGFLALVFFWSLYYLYYAAIIGASKSLYAKLAVANVMTFLLVRLAVLVLMPIIFIANVNGFIFQLNELFKASSPDDFEAIGGVERWKTYIADSPLVWTIFGLWVTWERLIAAAYSVVFILPSSIGAFSFLKGSSSS